MIDETLENEIKKKSNEINLLKQIIDNNKKQIKLFKKKILSIFTNSNYDFEIKLLKEICEIKYGDKILNNIKKYRIYNDLKINKIVKLIKEKIFLSDNNITLNSNDENIILNDYLFNYILSQSDFIYINFYDFEDGYKKYLNINKFNKFKIMIPSIENQNKILHEINYYKDKIKQLKNDNKIFNDFILNKEN